MSLLISYLNVTTQMFREPEPPAVSFDYLFKVSCYAYTSW